ncbi:hypothetical protein AGOR_G00196800 [Albula goreensis]|uniref:Uncharacterized protein n=1 Tax=Albula goreensis TaxID=1534307 RepID=A0A8T3CVN7_9TELE|nr:hypothetical protein AGOR_G00196800 [Albula goreensis]
MLQGVQFIPNNRTNRLDQIHAELIEGKAPTRPATLRPVPSPPTQQTAPLQPSPALLVPLGQSLRLTGAHRAKRAAGLLAHVEKKADELARLWTALPHGDKLRPSTLPITRTG